MLKWRYERTRCSCHPATCGCNPWSVFCGDALIARVYEETQAKLIVETAHRAEKAEADAKWWKSDAEGRKAYGEEMKAENKRLREALEAIYTVALEKAIYFEAHGAQLSEAIEVIDICGNTAREALHR